MPEKPSLVSVTAYGIWDNRYGIKACWEIWDRVFSLNVLAGTITLLCAHSTGLRSLGLHHTAFWHPELPTQCLLVLKLVCYHVHVFKCFNTEDHII